MRLCSTALYTNSKSCDSAIMEAEKTPSEITFQLVLGWGVLFHSPLTISAVCLVVVSPACDLKPEMLWLTPSLQIVLFGAD